MTKQATQPEPLFASFVALMLDTLTGLLPGQDDTAEASRRDIARIMFDALQPRDAVDAMLAARAVAAHFAAMDGYARAAQPDMSDEKVIRLRASAIAASRSFDAAVRIIEKHRVPAPAPVTEGARPDVPAEPESTSRQPDATAPPPVPERREPTTPSSHHTAYRLATALAALPGPESQSEFAACALPSVPVPLSSDDRHAAAVGK